MNLNATVGFLEAVQSTPDKIVNLSCWNSVEALHNYVYRSADVEVMRRKKEWFHKMGEAFTFKRAFPAPIELANVPTDTWGGECPAT